MEATTASTGTSDGGFDLERELEKHRRELTGYCYRMLGSAFEAEDAVQDTFVKAWKGYGEFEGRAALRSWLYRIATNVCLDMHRRPQRRARPMDLGGPGTPDTPALATAMPESTWVQPMRDDRILPEADPADVAMGRDSVRLAFVAALQHLPPKQRAVLILREVLRWQASEVAELLGTSVASVNSALQRARATLEGLDLEATSAAPTDERAAELVARYVDAFERYDMDALVALLHEDATFSMPPLALWLQGPADITRFMVTQGAACEGSKLLATSANGCAAFGSYKPARPGVWEPWSIQVLEVDDEGITAIHNFLGGELFPHFDLPPRIEE